MSEPALSAAPAGPITGAQRIVSLDVLRGFAVLGILVMNIQSFAMPGAAYMNPTAYGDLEGVNRLVWLSSHLFADQKFWTIFSMLFGAGIVLMTTRQEARGRGSAGVHYRRMGWLLLFGLLHAHLLWYGDILYFYALCGLVAWVFRKLPPWLLILLGLLAICVTFGMSVLTDWALASGTMPEQAVAGLAEAWHPPPEVVEKELAAYRGGWLDQMGHRVRSAIFFETFLLVFFIGWRTGGIVLIGMALHKLRVFSAGRSRIFYAALVAIAVLVGIPAIAYGVQRNFEAGWSLEYSFHLGGLYNFWASLLVALGWVGVVMLVCKSGTLRPVTRPLAAVGQMALTNYLMQTIICTTIFYGHGFGQFGHFERWQQLLTVLAVWVFQLVASPIWLRFFRFGPFEWLWRSLTYLKPQPVLRKSNE